MGEDLLQYLGPLAALAGVWEGDKGADVAPDDNRGTEHNPYRERLTFEPIGPVNNHEQQLYGLRYSLVVFRLSDGTAFHEESGYWLWDAAAKQVLRCFSVPRGVTVLAGGTVEPDATSFQLAADVGSETYGICSNPFLDREFKTVRFEVTITVHGPDSFSYHEDTQLKMMGRSDLFHHTDTNRVTRVR
ncbi:MAG: FABP family protein [Nitrospira sp.]|nr:FABP family protein [Nitrospira sp.]